MEIVFEANWKYRGSQLLFFLYLSLLPNAVPNSWLSHRAAHSWTRWRASTSWQIKTAINYLISSHTKNNDVVILLSENCVACLFVPVINKHNVPPPPSPSNSAKATGGNGKLVDFLVSVGRWDGEQGASRKLLTAERLDCPVERSVVRLRRRTRIISGPKIVQLTKVIRLFPFLFV